MLLMPMLLLARSCHGPTWEDKMYEVLGITPYPAGVSLSTRWQLLAPYKYRHLWAKNVINKLRPLGAWVALLEANHGCLLYAALKLSKR
jgi:hypothetical protein